MIHFRRYIPLTIRHLVKCIWYMEVNADTGLYEEELIPDGHHELIFYLDNSIQRTQSSATNWQTHPAASVVGQSLQSNRIKMFPGSRLYGIRFYPHTIYSLFRVPVQLFTSAITPLDDVLKHHSFWDHITDNPDSTFIALERYLGGILQRDLSEQPGYRYVEFSTARILNSLGGVQIKELVQKTGITIKHHDELFKKYVGITPKLLGSVLKFNNFILYRALPSGKDAYRLCLCGRIL